MFEALSFADIEAEERSRLVQELNHCHGKGKGHPCTGKGGAATKVPGRFHFFGVRAKPIPKGRSWLKLDVNGKTVKE